MTTEIPKFVTPGQLLAPLYKPLDDKSIVKFESGKGTAIQEFEIGNTRQKVISSTLVGNVKVEEIIEEEKGEEEKDSNPEADEDKEVQEKLKNALSVKKYKISVINSNFNDYKDFEESESEQREPVKATTEITNNLPKEGDIVLTRVTKLSLKQAHVEILVIEGNGNILKDSGVGANGSITTNTNSYGSHSNFFQIHLNSSDLGENFKGIIRIQDVRSTERDKVKIIEMFKPGDIVRAQVLSLGDGSNYYLTTARNDLGVVFAKSNGGAGALMYAIDWQTMVCPKTGEIELRKCAKPF
jgi:exosome complex component CSL4